MERDILKKAAALFARRPGVVFAWIDADEGRVHRSGSCVSTLLGLTAQRTLTLRAVDPNLARTHY